MPRTTNNPTGPTMPGLNQFVITPDGGVNWNPSNWGAALPFWTPSQAGSYGVKPAAGTSPTWKPPNVGPYSSGSYGWAPTQYGMRSTGATYSNVGGGRGNGGKNWQSVYENYAPTAEEIEAQKGLVMQATANAVKKGGSSMGLLQKQRKLKLLQALYQKNTLKGQGQQQGTGQGGDGQPNYNQNGLVNWSI